MFPEIVWLKDASDTANPTLYPRTKDNLGLIKPTLCPDPVDVNSIIWGISLVAL